MRDLPMGAVTMLFTDIEGSTPLVHRLEDGYGALLADYRRLLRKAVADAGGHEIDCRADELFAVFEHAADGVAAAVAAQRMLAQHVWPAGARVRVRMGLHSGTPALEGTAYLGVDVHRAARICAAAHGGQVLLSQATRDLVEVRFQASDLGRYSLAGIREPERLFQLQATGLRSEFPPLRAERTDRRRMAGTRRRRPSREATFAEAAWHVRRLLPTVEAPLLPRMGELGATLFTADRALTGADGFLERVDRKRLARRLDAQMGATVYLQHAQEEAGRLRTRIACVEQLDDRRHALASLAPGLPDKLDAFRTEREITLLGEQLTAATDELDQAFAYAARELDPLSFKLQRTRYRGVYRNGSRYVVPYSDEHGRDRPRDFDTLAEAHEFKRAVRIAHERRHEVASGSIFGGRVWGDTDSRDRPRR